MNVAWVINDWGKHINNKLGLMKIELLRSYLKYKQHLNQLWFITLVSINPHVNLRIRLIEYLTLKFFKLKLGWLCSIVQKNYKCE